MTTAILPNGHTDVWDADYAPPAVMPVRLNLGAGPFPLEGYENLDRKTGQEIYPLDYPDDFADEIRASHCLEHFSHRFEVASVIRDWVRVLKPGGVLKLAVPNFEWLARSYLNGDPVDIQGITMGGHGDADDHHGAIFDQEQLTRDMRQMGLYDIRHWKSELGDCAATPCSLNLRGTKKAPLPKLTIACAMSVPRLGFQDHFFCWTKALLPLGITPCVHHGVFWGQCLERVMSDMLDADLILTLDYDTVFDRDNVEHLIRIAAAHPEADAVIPMQIRRQGNTPLATFPGADGKPQRVVDTSKWDTEELLPALTGHFGLTLIRTAALKRMEHPWFLGVPDANGTWGEDRKDDDVYFWEKWRKTGNSLFLAPHVVVAHGEFVLTWPGRGMKTIYQHPSDFWENGAPEEVWR